MHSLLLGTDDGGRRALTAVEQLREVTVTHLDHEEQVLEPVYLAHVDEPRDRRDGQEVRAGTGTAHGRDFFAWVLDGATPRGTRRSPRSRSRSRCSPSSPGCSVAAYRKNDRARLGRPEGHS